MQKITLLAVGSIKESFYREAVREYVKRLSSYCKLEILEVPDEKTREGLSQTERERILKKEGEGLRRKREGSDFTIALALEGRRMSSEAFSRKLQDLAGQGKSRVSFMIGGSLGLHPDLLAEADFLLSFSDMTFPHQLMRVIFLEQLYRAYKIAGGEPYHK